MEWLHAAALCLHVERMSGAMVGGWTGCVWRQRERRRLAAAPVTTAVLAAMLRQAFLIHERSLLSGLVGRCGAARARANPMAAG